MTERPSSYTMQFGGTHYVGMKMQPFEFTLRNQWDGAAHSILKYLSRHATKNGLEDLRKARHIVDIRQNEIADALPGNGRIAMADYIEVNGFKGDDAEALLALEGWVQKRLPETTLVRLIDGLIDAAYLTPRDPALR